MSEIEINVPSLVGGVSQQAIYIRRPDQVEESVNAYPSLVNGLEKRPNTQYLARIQSGSTATFTGAIHTIDRGDGNVFTLIVQTGGITAYNATGGTINVIDDTSGYSYLTGATPLTDYKLVTVQDYTFLVNKTRTPAMYTGLTSGATYGTEGYVFVKQGNYDIKYTLKAKLTGSTEKSISINTWAGASATAAAIAGDLVSLQTNQIATSLQGKALTGLASGGVTGNWFQYTSDDNSVFQFYRTANDLDYFMASDSVSSTALSVITNSTVSENTETNTERTRQLPTYCRNGYKLSVLGEAASEADDYYIEFVGEAATGLSKGTWRETIAHDTKYQINAATMPHQLVLEATGSTYQFRFQTVDWDDKAVGDATSNPDPSFIGRPIQDIFFFQDRLGLAAQDRVLMSQQGEYFNFFRSTLKSNPDTERIDVQVSHNRVVNINHVVPYNKSLLLFSDLGQFILNGEVAISSKTISITPVAEFQASDLVKPALAGRSVYFAYDNGDYAGIREFYQTSDLDTFDAVEITNGIPQYIKGRIQAMAVNTLESVMAVLTDEEQHTLYLYKYQWNGNQKVLSSWGKWKFGQPAISPNIKIYHMAWVDTDLYVLIKRRDGIYLEKLVLSPGQIDSGSEFVTLLDRRLDETGVSISYSAANNQTTITLPYQLNSLTEMKVISKEGLRYEVDSFTGGGYGIVVRGNLTGVEFWIGETYTMTVTITPPVVKYKTENGYVPNGPSVQKARRCYIYFKESRHLKAEVQISNRGEYTYIFNGPSLGSPEAVLGTVPLSDGVLKATIMGDSKLVSMDIVNDSPYPSNIVSMNWIMEWRPKASRWQS